APRHRGAPDRAARAQRPSGPAPAPSRRRAVRGRARDARRRAGAPRLFPRRRREARPRGVRAGRRARVPGYVRAAMSGITYKQAGVDVEAGDELVERIKPLAARTRIPEMLGLGSGGGVGGFAGLCGLPTGMKEPVLVSGTDGVGTKLKVAFLADRH